MDLSEENAALKRRIIELERERDHWKANHDNQVKIKSAVLDRPDLGDRARSVQAMMKRIAELEAAITILARGHFVVGTV